MKAARLGTDHPVSGTMMDLNALRSTLAIASHGGIAGAHRATAIPKSTLSRHLAELERALGIRIVERSSRRFRMTAEGEALVALAARPMAELSDVEERIRPNDGPLAGRLRISVPFLFGQSLLGKVATAFAEAHPGVFLEAVADDRHIDLLREGFDAALRVNPTPESTLTGRLLGRNQLLLVATPELGHRLKIDPKAPELTSWPAIVRKGWGDSGFWEVDLAGRHVRVTALPRLALSSPAAILDAVLGHVGAALLPQTLVSEHLAAGRLMPLGARAGAGEEICIVHSAGRLPSRRLIALMDILEATFAPFTR